MQVEAGRTLGCCAFLMRVRLHISWAWLALLGCREPVPSSSTAVPSSARSDPVFVEVQTLDDGSKSRDWADVRESAVLEVHIPGGSMDGTPIDSYYLDLTETTVEAYSKCVAAGVCSPAKSEARALACVAEERRNSPKLPINCVTQTQASVYCEWVGKRLPTGAELKWEAIGGEENRFYPWGESQPDCSHGSFVVYDYSSGRNKQCGEGIMPVGSYPAGASTHGILDMEGNLSEWVSDTGYRAVVAAGFSYIGEITFSRGYATFEAQRDRPYPTIGVRCARSAE